MMRSSSMRAFYDPEKNLCFFSRTEFRVFFSSAREMMESLWEEFFRDPSQFIDVRNIKKSHKFPDFRHKVTGKALWINRSNNPPDVRGMLQRIKLPKVEINHDRDGVIQMIKSCGMKKDISMLKRTYAENNWITQDMPMAATLIRSYAKCGAMKEAQQVFDQLLCPNVVCWTSLISAYVDQGLGKEAITCYKEMQRNRVTPNSVTYICTLKACAIVGAIDIVKEIYTRVRDQGILSKDVVLVSTLVDAYAKCGSVKEAREVFDHLKEPNVVSWTALIAGYADQGFGEEALTCFMEMQRHGVTPDPVTYICTLKASAIVGALEIVEDIHAQVGNKRILNKNIALGNMLIDAYAKCGALKEAQRVFEQLAEPNVVSWTALIAGYADKGFGEEALTFFEEMPRRKVTPNSVTYICALKACAILGAVEIVRGIYTRIIDFGLLNKDIALGNMLVDTFAKCGAVKEALEVFEQLPETDVVSWTALIAGYADQGFGEEALTCFREMQRKKVTPDMVTYSCVLKACAIVGALEVVKEIHAHVRDKGLLNKDIVLGCTLVSAYAKSGSMKEAQEVFNNLEKPAVVSWNAILAGYAKSGHMNEMLDLFDRMIISGVFPECITYVVLLNGCSHGALLDEGQQLFHMIGANGLDWTPEHCTCMIDLFGRAGRFDQAKCFVLNETSTLLAFLGACRIWSNVDEGRWAFEKLIQLDRKCECAYVRMSDIYAAAGMMEEADEVQFLRVKESWLESGASRVLHGFVVAEHSHINSKLGQLSDIVIPDLYWMSKLFPDHEKDKIVCRHNEKLAIAYVLINITKSEFMQVNKNM